MARGKYGRNGRNAEEKQNGIGQGNRRKIGRKGEM